MKKIKKWKRHDPKQLALLLAATVAASGFPAIPGGDTASTASPANAYNGSVAAYAQDLRREEDPSETEPTSVMIRQTSCSSNGIFTLKWEIEPDAGNCSGVEIAGTGQDDNLVVLADLPAEDTTYTITGENAFAYSSFVVRVYVINGTEKIYEAQDSTKNDLYTDSYLSKNGITDVKTHTPAQIRAMYRKLSPQRVQSRFKKAPRNKKPYSKGTVARSTLKAGLNTLNFIRYIAGISPDVKIKKEYQSKAQAAAVVNYNDKTTMISHYPQKPAGMKDPLYQEGSVGSASSNLAGGYGTLYDVFIEGWMSDSDLSNIDRVGHRRWCLNPFMGYTGFGIDENIYAMYAFDASGNGSGVHGVHWPARNMPVNLFHDTDAWSISMGTVIEDTDLTVTLTRKRDNKKWKFTSKKKNANGNYMNVENGGYGQKGCIIFRPKSIRYQSGDKFKVAVKGSSLSFSYNVNFFSL